MDTVQPQNLGVALLLGAGTGAVGGGVVTAALGVARTALDGADVLVLDHDAHGVDALLVVAAYGGGDDHEGGVMDGVNAQGLVVTEHQRTEVERGTGGGGSPILLHVHEGGQHLHTQLLGDLGQAQTLGGAVQTADVLNGTEELNLAVGATVGLQTLEDLGAIVQNRSGGMDRQVAEGDDAGIVPTTLGLVLHEEHVVGKDLTESQGGGIGLDLGGGGLGDGNIHNSSSLS